MKGIILILIILSSLVQRVAGQDIHFSQYDNSPIGLNPALTGDFNGNVRIVANHRNQWSCIDVPYLTTATSFDTKLLAGKWQGDALGVGFLIFHDKAGEGGLQHLQPMACFAYHHRTGKKKNTLLSAGVEGGVFNRWIDYSKLYFGSQFDEGDFNRALSSNENETMYNITRFDLTAGGALRIIDKKSEYSIGYSLHHLTRPDESLLGNKNRIHMNHAVNMDDKIRLSTQFFITPRLLILSQNKALEVLPGVKGIYIIQSTDGNETVLGGAIDLRLKDAFVFTFTLGFVPWQFGFSYDINYSTLVPASKSRGGFEISVIYIDEWIRGKNDVTNKIPCQRM